MSVRVRFAPSPTGPLHIGGVRTALYNYLFAKKHGGDFIIRIEDTDQTRFVEGAEQYILDSLQWLNIMPNEGQGVGGDYGSYKQSERKEIYQQYIQELLENGKAYYAFDTPEELDELRKEYESRKEVFSYDASVRENLNNSLQLSQEEVNQRLASGEKYVIRFKIPANEVIEMQDIVRGKVTVNSNTLDDKVLFKSDGLPTYHFANIVDDHLMKITHVIRGEEWLPSMPLHVMLYRAFGWEAPEFAHLALILKPTGKGKLSKRDGAEGGFPIFPLTWEDSIGYREEGYLPESVVNMLALLGWNPGTEQEIFSLEELAQAFDLTKVSKSGARFSKEKAVWFNHQYMQQKSDAELLQLFKNQKESNLSDEVLLKIITLVKERANFPQDLVTQSMCFFENPSKYDEKAMQKAWKEDTPALMQELVNCIKNIDDFSVENLEKEIKGWISAKEIGFGKVMQPLRIALVGELSGPDLMQIMNIIGKENTLERLQNIIAK